MLAGPFYEGVQHREQGVRIDFQFGFAGGILYEFVAVEGVLVQVDGQAYGLEPVFRKDFYVVFAYLKGSVELAVFFQPVGKAYTLVQVFHSFLLQVGVDVQFAQGYFGNFGILGDDVRHFFFGLRRFVIVGTAIVNATAVTSQVNVVDEYGILGVRTFGLETDGRDFFGLERYGSTPALLGHLAEFNGDGFPLLGRRQKFHVVVGIRNAGYFHMDEMVSTFVSIGNGSELAVVLVGRQLDAPTYVWIILVSALFQGIFDIERELAAVVAFGGCGVSF